MKDKALKSKRKKFKKVVWVGMVGPDGKEVAYEFENTIECYRTREVAKDHFDYVRKFILTEL